MKAAMMGLHVYRNAFRNGSIASICMRMSLHCIDKVSINRPAYVLRCKNVQLFGLPGAFQVIPHLASNAI
jgi:hypothetical protein